MLWLRLEESVTASRTTQKRPQSVFRADAVVHITYAEQSAKLTLNTGEILYCTRTEGQIIEKIVAPNVTTIIKDDVSPEDTTEQQENNDHTD